jgi:hypothetical protein
MSTLQHRLQTDEAHARRVAHILGESSAAAEALQELDQRRRAGEDVGIFLVGPRWIVGPKPGSPE